MKKLLLLLLISFSVVGTAENSFKNYDKSQESIRMYILIEEFYGAEDDSDEDGNDNYGVLGGPSDSAICRVTPEACSGNAH